MRALFWAFRIVIFLFLFAFSLKNTDLVNLRFMFDTTWQAPLVIVVLVFFASGALLGVLSLLGDVYRLRREVASLGREMRQVQTNNSAAPHSPSASVITRPVND